MTSRWRKNTAGL